MQKMILGLLLTCAFLSCRKENRECPSSTEKEFNLTGFTRIAAGESFSLQIKQGAAYSIKAKGCSNDLADLSMSIGQGGVLNVSYNRYKNDRYKVAFEITLPTIAALNLSGAATADITGFGQQSSALRVVLSGAATCRLEALPTLVRVDLSGTGKLTMTGTATDLIASLSGDSRLNAYTASFDDVDMYASGTGKAYVQVQKSLAAFASGASRVFFKGNPASVNIEESGTAKVVRE